MKSIFVKVLLVLVFLALVANLVVSAVTGSSLATEELAKQVAFWALIAADLCVAGAGIYFASRSYHSHQRSSVRWARRAFALNLILTLVFAAAPWFFYSITEEHTRVDAMFEASLILLLFGISTGVFAFASYREYVRTAEAEARASRRRPKMSRSDKEGRS